MAKTSSSPAPGWVRLPGEKTRQYMNTDTGEILSRRQYDKLHGRLAQAGLASNEAQARANLRRDEAEQLLRPARGRTSAQKTQALEREIVKSARLEQAHEKKAHAAVEREARRKARVPKKITARNFKPGRKGRAFRVPYDPESIEAFVREAANYKGALGYTVGIEFVDSRTGKVGAATVLPARFMDEDFTEDDWQEVEDYEQERSYMDPTFAVVYIALSQAAYEKLAKK